MKKTTLVKTLSTKSADEFDVAFIEIMTKHHNEAIELAKLAKEKSKRKEILQLAQDIISAQTKENEQMKEWKSEWE